MATYTENYNLSKPGPEDAANIDVINSNSDKIDAAIKQEETERKNSQEQLQEALDAANAKISAKANASDVLTKTNTTSYTPSGAYHPATKKYVDDKAANIPTGSISGTIPVSKGGTGSTTAAGALSNLGIKIQTTIPSSLNNGEIVFVVEG